MPPELPNDLKIKILAFSLLGGPESLHKKTKELGS